jgi:hypothetical protein
MAYDSAPNEEAASTERLRMLIAPFRCQRKVGRCSGYGEVKPVTAVVSSIIWRSEH